MHNQGSRRRSRRWKSLSAGLMVGWRTKNSLAVTQYDSDTSQLCWWGLSSAAFLATTLSESALCCWHTRVSRLSAGRGGEKSAGPSSSVFHFVFCHQVLSILFSISLHIHPFFFFCPTLPPFFFSSDSPFSISLATALIQPCLDFYSLLPEGLASPVLFPRPSLLSHNLISPEHRPGSVPLLL